MKVIKSIRSVLLCTLLLCLFIPGSVLADEGAAPSTGNTESSTGGTDPSTEGTVSPLDGTGPSTGGTQSPTDGTDGTDPTDGLVPFADGTNSPYEITTTLDLANQATSPQMVGDGNGNGYIWDSDGEGGYVLTLANVRIIGDQTDTSPDGTLSYAIKVPGGKKVTIKTEGAPSVLDGGIITDATASGPLNVVFDGAELTINGWISSGVNNDTVEVLNGAKVTLDGRFNLGASSNDTYIIVNGPGSTLTSTGEVWVNHLEVTGGGTLAVNNTIRIMSIYSGGTTLVPGSIRMDTLSSIIINAKPTLVSIELNETMTDSDILLGVLDNIKAYLPAGYQIGIGEMVSNNGQMVAYCTILDSDGNIASSLTLKEQVQDPGNTGGNPTPPATPGGTGSGGVYPPAGNKPSTPDKKPDTDDSDDGAETPPEDPGTNEDPSAPGTDNGTSSAGQGTQAAAGTAPRTGDYGTAGMWLFCILGSAAAIYLAGWYKTRKN